jgi:tetratricopeptide (TPR) repeat protein
MIEKLMRQKAFYQRKLAQGPNAQLESNLAAVEAEIKKYSQQEKRSYLDAAYYGYDMAAIHHNLGAIYMQRGETSNAVASFRRGMAADKYSYPTIYSFLLLRLREAAETGKPEIEEEALREAQGIVQSVYSRLKKTYLLDEEGMQKDQTVQQFARLEQTLIQSRLKNSLSKALELKKMVDQKPDDISRHLQYATFLYQRQDTEGLVRAFERAPEVKWQNEMLVYYYGNAQQQNGDVDDAIASFERLSREKPLFFLAVFRLAQMYDIIKKDSGKALDVYRRVLAISEAEARIQYPAYGNYYAEIARSARQRVNELAQ